MRFFVFISFLISLSIVLCDGTNVLIIFSIPSKSHTILGHALGHGLVDKGHNVTMLSPFPQNKAKLNYHDLELTEVTGVWTTMMRSVGLPSTWNHRYEMLFKIFEYVANITEVTIQEANVQKVLNSGSSFDVVIISSLFNDALFAIAHQFNAPIILFATTGPSYITHHYVGNPSPYAYAPELFLPYSDRMTFFQRCTNTLLQVVANIAKYFFHLSAQEKIREKYFPNAPSAYELTKKVSLLFTNSHRCLEYARPLVPNIIEVGGLQVGKPKPLPKELQTFLDDAPDGVIYFSLGTNIRSEHMSNETKQAFVEVFSQLKEKILWKWDELTIPGLSKNVHLGQWFPQSDVLAHPNVKIFITHGGLLSTTETVIRGVPCLGIPIFGDQHRNMDTAIKLGFAVTVDYKNVTTQSLNWALNEVLLNPKYRNTATQLSSVLNDHIVHPLDKAVYWVEYVIRHKGAAHLRTVGADIPFYQYLLLDVVGFVLLTLALVFSILYFTCKLLIKIVKKLFGQAKTKKD